MQDRERAVRMESRNNVREAPVAASPARPVQLLARGFVVVGDESGPRIKAMPDLGVLCSSLMK
jgi:hypothetical protein